MNKLFFILFLIYCNIALYSQKKEINIIEDSLIRFLVTEEEIDISCIDGINELYDYFFIIELIDSSKVFNKDLGIYKFGLTITHTKKYLLLNNKLVYKILSVESFEDAIHDVNEFFRENPKEFNLQQKREYLIKIANNFINNSNESYLDLIYK